MLQEQKTAAIEPATTHLHRGKTASTQSMAADRRREMPTSAEQVNERPRLRTIPKTSLTSTLKTFTHDLASGVPVFFADALGIGASLLLTAGICSLIGSPGATAEIFSMWKECSAFILVYLVLGMYPGIGINPIRELKCLVLGSLTAGGILGFITLGFKGANPWSLFQVGTITLLSMIFVPIFRATAKEILGRTNWWGQKTIIIGEGRAVRTLYETMKRRPAMGLKPIGTLNHQRDSKDNHDETFLGHYNDADRIAKESGASWALVALSDIPQDRHGAVISACSTIPRLILIPKFEDCPSLWSRTHDVGGILGIHVQNRLLCPLRQFSKRAMDAVIAATVGLLSLPFLAVTCLLIKLKSPGPAFYADVRLGKNGKHFKAWKIRTMVIDANKLLQEHLANDPQLKLEWDQTQKLKNDPRVIPGIGGFLRKTSLDELPQVWNVLVGEMSLVGPRPTPPKELEVVLECNCKRKAQNGMIHPGSNPHDELPEFFSVRPGMTGLWQVSGRNLTTLEVKYMLHDYYVRNWSLWLDLFIIARTVRTVLFREGAF